MTEPKHIAPDAVGLVSLPPMALERLTAELHARSCPECARALAQAERILSTIDAHLDLPPPSPHLLKTALVRARAVAALPIVATPVATVLTLVTVLAVAGAPAGEGPRWLAAASLAILGGVLSWQALAAGSVRLVAAAAALLSITFAAAFAGPGAIAPLLGLRCAVVEWVPIAAGMAALYVSKRGLAVRDRWRAVAFVAALGLCAQAALIVCCPARMGALHVLLFHSGGVLAFCAIAAFLGPRLGGRFSSVSG